jgi:ketosteroid isomerase-like protein
MSHEETVRAAYSAWNRDYLESFFATLHPEDGWTSRRPSPEVVDRGKKLLTAVRVPAKGRPSGVPIEGEIFHIGTMRDELIGKIEGFTDRDAAMRALDAT